MRLRMKIGTPSWWSPPQPPAGSKVPRPATTAPVDMNSSIDLAVHARGAAGGLEVAALAVRKNPLVQPLPAVAEPVVQVARWVRR